MFFALILGAAVRPVYPAQNPPFQRSASRDTVAWHCFAAAESLAARGDKVAAIAALENLTRLRPKMGSALHRLAQLRIDVGGLENRIRAGWNLNQALGLEPKNPAYLYTQALLYVIIDMYGPAQRLFKKVIDFDPKNVDAYLWLGYISEQDWFWYRDMISEQVDIEGSPILTFTTSQYARNDLKKAMTCYRNAVAIDPGCKEAWKRLALLHFENGEIDSMARVLEKAVLHNSEDKNIHLFLGMAFQRQRRLEDAGREYDTARSMMRPEERSLFENPAWIDRDTAFEPERKGRSGIIKNRKSEADRSSFWKSRDPLFLTDANERLMEHYGRMAYANLRFSRLRDKVEGWNTDPGRAVIRYGKPIFQSHTRPDLYCRSIATWQYPGCTMTFVDQSLKGRFNLADRAEYTETVRKNPESFSGFSKDEEFGLVCTTACFRDSSEAPVLDVFESLPESDAGLARGVVLKRGVFLFDLSWKEIFRKVDRDPFFVFPTQSILGVAWNRIRVKPGTYHLAVEFSDDVLGKVGRWRRKIEIPPMDGFGPVLSDLVVLRETDEYREKGEWRRGGLRMIPNTLETYGILSSVPLYFEIYNLAFMPEGRTRYRVTQIVTPLGYDRPVGFFDSVKKWLGRNRQRGQVRTSYEAEGDQASETVFRVLDIENPIPGQYRLEVRVEDLVSGQSAVRRKVITFREVE